MKICVTASGQDLDDMMDPRFGRCRYLIIAETESAQFEAIQNPGISAGSGAGIQAGQLVVNKGVEAVLTGNVGPNAYTTLSAADIKIIVGLTGITVRQAIEDFKAGKHAYSPPVLRLMFIMAADFRRMAGCREWAEAWAGVWAGAAAEVWADPCNRAQLPGSRTSLSPDEELQEIKTQSQKMKQDLASSQERIDALINKGTSNYSFSCHSPT